MLSVVIPIHNEEPSVLALYDRLTSVLESLAQPYEIIFVDDASTDRSFALLANLMETDSRDRNPNSFSRGAMRHMITIFGNRPVNVRVGWFAWVPEQFGKAPG